MKKINIHSKDALPCQYRARQVQQCTLWYTFAFKFQKFMAQVQAQFKNKASPARNLQKYIFTFVCVFMKHKKP